MRLIDADRLEDIIRYNIDKWEGARQQCIDRGESSSTVRRMRSHAIDYIRFLRIVEDQPVIECTASRQTGGNDWISVKNELPESNDNIRKEYIVCIDNTDVTTLDYDFLEKHFFGYDEGGYSHRVPEVTHWMPLPKPPKED